MNTAHTSEGKIFRCEGEMETGMVRRILGGAGEGFPLGDILLARLAAGGGTFCVFRSEERDFNDLMRGLESSMELSQGSGGCGGGAIDLVREFRSVSEADQRAGGGGG